MSPPPPNSLQPAPLWRRWLALGYDLFILAAMSMAYSAIITALQVFISHTPPEHFQPTLTHPLFFIGWCTLIVAYFCYSWTKSGQTIGMKAWQIQLVPLQGRLRLSTALMRCLAGLAGTLLLGFGYLYKGLNKNKDCWQDAITHTRILKVGLKHTHERL